MGKLVSKAYSGKVGLDPPAMVGVEVGGIDGGCLPSGDRPRSVGETQKWRKWWLG